MKIAVYGKSFAGECDTHITQFFSLLASAGAEVFLYAPFYEYLKTQKQMFFPVTGTFTSGQEVGKDFGFIFSIGGDGTFLETISIVRDSGIPVIGMNTGRLGFLSNIAKEEITTALQSIFSGNYKLMERSLLKVTFSHQVSFGFPYALNEFTLQKAGSFMITIHTWVNDEFLNSYWADGLIISTPTGSTAYSMSVGGPIVTPSARDFIISPIAPHHLTVRPIVVSDSCRLKLTVESRDKKAIASLDYQSCILPDGAEIILQKAPFTVRTVQLEQSSFFNTLRNKLMWGADKRN